MLLYDTHCHPNLSVKKDKNEIIKRFKIENKSAFLNCIGTDLKTSIDAINLAKTYDYVKASIWIHPCDIDWLELEDTIDKLEKILIENKKYIVAIWETWLDYYRLWSIFKNEADILKTKELQKQFFIAQIKLAKKYNLILVIHNREAKDDIFEILKNTWIKNFIFHCYTEDLEYANKILEYSKDAFISFSWIISFNNTNAIKDTAKYINLENILIETDSPYLSPIPFRWKEENEPNFVKIILEEIVKLRKESREVIEKQIFLNSKKAFKIE